MLALTRICSCLLRLVQVLTRMMIAALALCATPLASAQDYPNKRITIVVANTPGTTVDTVSRLLSPELGRILGQTIIVENRPGADSIIGFEYVARQAPADGYTIAAMSVSSLAALPAVAKDLRFNPLTDLPMVTILGAGRYVLGTSPKTPYKSLAELAGFARQNPGKLNYGSFGSVVRMLAEAVVRDYGLDMVHIPYSGGSQFVQALVGNEVQLGFMNEAAAIGLGEKLRVLAVTGDKRRPPFNDVPTFTELGYPHFQGASVSFNVRAGTPKAIVDKLYEATAKTLENAEVKARFARLQLEILADTPEVSARKFAAEAKLFMDIAKKP